jgi:hypothetical protein
VVVSVVVVVVVDDDKSISDDDDPKEEEESGGGRSDDEAAVVTVKKSNARKNIDVFGKVNDLHRRRIILLLFDMVLGSEGEIPQQKWMTSPGQKSTQRQYRSKM